MPKLPTPDLPTKSSRPKWMVVGVIFVAVVSAYLLYDNLFRSTEPGLDEIAARLGMDCDVTEIAPDRELVGVRLKEVIEGQVFNCLWEDKSYEVIGQTDLDNLTEALIEKLPEATGRSPADLTASCRSLIFSANIDNLIRKSLILTPDYAFVSYSQAADLRQAMEAEGIDLAPIPSACDEFLSQAN